MIFVTSDTHFNHANIIKYCNRPFSSTKEMNEELIRRWNAKVSKNDIVIHLGDFAFGRNWESIKDIRNKLNGIIILVVGNHDYNKAYQLGKAEKTGKRLGNVYVRILQAETQGMFSTK